MLDEIVTVVKKCGDIILFADGAERNVSSKEGRANFVTKYDVAVQAYLEEELLKILPEAVFIGEEENTAKQLVKVMHLLWTLSMERPILSKIITEAACLWDWHFMGLWKSALFITHTVMRCFMRSEEREPF